MLGTRAGSQLARLRLSMGEVEGTKKDSVLWSDFVPFVVKSSFKRPPSRVPHRKLGTMTWRFSAFDSRFRCSSRSEEHTSELQSHVNLVCRLLLEKKKKKTHKTHTCESQRTIIYARIISTT